MRTQILFLILFLINSTISLKAYRSIAVVNDTLVKTRQHGLHYLKQNQTATFTHSVTFCLRFNYQRLGVDARIWEIREPGSWVRFLFLSAEYPATWLIFGNNHRQNAHSNWLLHDPITNDFNIWRMNTWHSLCIAYNKKTSHIAVVKVSSISYLPFH